MGRNRASSGRPVESVSQSAGRTTAGRGTSRANEESGCAASAGKAQSAAATRRRNPALRALGIPDQTVALDLSVEVPAVHAQPLRRFGHVPGALPQRGQDRVPLGAIPRGADLTDRLLLGPRRKRLLDLPDTDRFSLAHDEEPLDQVFQLAHVSRPGIARQPLDGLGLELSPRPAVLVPEPLHEVADEERDVLAARAERLDVDGDDAQPVEEVLAETARLDLLGEVLVRGRDDARVHLDRAGAPQALDLTGLDGAEKFGLGVEAHVADLVQEERPPVRGLEPAPLHLRRSGEGSLFVPEELALHEVLGKRRAVQLLERSPGPRALAMDGARHQLLARAALSGDEHLGLAPRHLRDLGADLLHGVAFAHHLVGTSRETAKRFVLALERLQLQGALDGDVETVRAEGLLH